jgi:hypothetical protein
VKSYRNKHYEEKIPISFRDDSWLWVEADEPHGAVVTWSTDPTQSQLHGSFEAVVDCHYEKNFSVSLQRAGGMIESFRVRELVAGSSNPERKGLARRKMMRILAPQTQESPIYFHITTSVSSVFRKVVDQVSMSTQF